MWARIQEMGIRRETPEPLEPGKTVEGFKIKRALSPITGNRRYEAVKEWQTYELRQFYDVDTDAFLRWQNQARLAGLPDMQGVVRASSEWSGGVAIPDLRLPSLSSWLPESRDLRMSLAANLSALLGGLHAIGIVHQDLHPGAVLFRKNEPFLRHLGRCSIKGHLDLWPHYAGARIPSFNSPEQACCNRGGASSDVFAFGMILLHLFESSCPPHWLKTCLCSWGGAWRSISNLFSLRNVPTSLTPVVKATLNHTPEDRPTMMELCREFGVKPRNLPTLPRPEGESRKRIMALVSPDRHADAVFKRATELGEDGASILIVSLIPLNLAFGELELSKVRLFKALAKGLKKLRESKVDWGLVIRENVDETCAIRQLCERLEPELVLCGPASRTGIGAKLHPGVGNAIERTGCALERPCTQRKTQRDSR